MEKLELNKEKQLTEVERNALKNVYRSFLNYMEEFDNTFAFTSDEEGEPYEVAKAYDLFLKLQHDLNYEYIDLKRTVFDKLYAFVDEELSETIEWSNLSGITDLDALTREAKTIYRKMMNSFKDIINEYLV